MDTLWKQCVDILVDVLGTVLMTLLCIGVRYVIAWIKSRTHSETLNTALKELEDVVIEGIYFTEQTAVRELKATGNWNVTTQQEVLKECQAYIESTLSKKATNFLTNNLTADQLSDLITNKIESALGRIHAAEPGGKDGTTM